MPWWGALLPPLSPGQGGPAQQHAGHHRWLQGSMPPLDGPRPLQEDPAPGTSLAPLHAGEGMNGGRDRTVSRPRSVVMAGAWVGVQGGRRWKRVEGGHVAMEKIQ